MSKLTHRLVAAATLAAISLAGMTTVAHAQATDEQATLRPPTERQVGESWRHRQAAAKEQTAADAAVGRVLARERFSIPDTTPAQVPAPVPTQPNRQPSWLLAALGVLAVLMLVVGLAVLVARRASRRAPPPAQPDSDRHWGRRLTRRRRFRGRRSLPPAAPPRPLFTLVLQAHNQQGGVPVPMQPIHRLAQLAQRADGGTEWACPSVAATSSAIRRGSWSWRPEYPARPTSSAPSTGATHRSGWPMSEFDEHFLHRHAMAWSADHRPN